MNIANIFEKNLLFLKKNCIFAPIFAKISKFRHGNASGIFD